MSNSTDSPILVSPTSCDTGAADTAPGVIVIHSLTTLDDTLVVRLTGEIDHFSAAPLRALLTSAAADGYTTLVVDTSRVTFCDSGLLAALRWWPRHRRQLKLANTSPAFRRLLNAAGWRRHTPSAAAHVRTRAATS